jgi:hypothetical protein
MRTTTEQASASFPVMTVLFFIFLVLKLTDVIAWSWWWVAAPLWGPVVLVILFLLVILIVGLCK